MKRHLNLPLITLVLALLGGVHVLAQTPDPVIEHGQQLYMKHCASCHGKTGEGDGPLADVLTVKLQNLQTHVIHHDQASLFQMIAQGIEPDMPAFTTELDMDEISDLIAYIYTLEDSYRQALETAQQTPPDTTKETPAGSSAMGGMGDNWKTCPSERMGQMDDMSQMSQMAATDPMDAVSLGADLDGDNDPDEITICLQILEVTQEIAPGIVLPFWVFAPDLGGMQPLARLPGPTLRVEQGDHVRIVLKNTHYFPHTLHLHGVLKPNAMDGVPDITQPAIQPGETFVYDFVAQNPGTHWYHCHVQTPLHLMMGLYGVFIIEPDRPQNFVTPIVMGSRMPELSAASQEAGYTEEYVLAYQDIDPNLNQPLWDAALSPAQLEKRIHRDYNFTQRVPNYFTLNGRSFPYTLLDSLVQVRPEEKVLLRVLNAGAKPISLHLHGHHATPVAYDGTPIPKAQRVARDTFTLTAAQRADIVLDTHADGFHASGSGVWLLHDHSEEAITTNGINPGGNITVVAYEDALDEYGLPKVAGDLSKYFAPSYYRGQDPVFADPTFVSDPDRTARAAQSTNPLSVLPLWVWVTVAGTVGLLLGVLSTKLVIGWTRRKT